MLHNTTNKIKCCFLQNFFVAIYNLLINNMTLKEEYKKLVDRLKENAKKQDKKLSNEEIATSLGYERSYFSTLLGSRGNVTEDHLKTLKLHFPELLGNTTKTTKVIPLNNAEEDWQSKYNKLLEDHLDIKNALFKRLDEIEKDIDSFKKSHDLTKEEQSKLRHSHQVSLAMQIAFQEHWLQHFFGEDPKTLAQKKKSIAKTILGSLAKLKKESIEKAVGIDPTQDSGNKNS
jgi:hypothetical protein